VVKCGALALTGERGLLKGVNPEKVPEAKVAALSRGAFVSVSNRGPVFPAQFGLHLARQKIVHQALARYPAPAGRPISSSTRRGARRVTGVCVARRGPPQRVQAVRLGLRACFGPGLTWGSGLPGVSSTRSMTTGAPGLSPARLRRVQDCQSSRPPVVRLAAVSGTGAPK
jgi:hypothetical protein